MDLAIIIAQCYDCIAPFLEQQYFSTEDTIMELNELINSRMLGIRIRNGRRALHISQAKLAEQIDLSVPYISLIENGRKNPSLECLIAIADILNLSLDYLLFGVDGKSTMCCDPQLQSLLSDCSLHDQKLLLEHLQMTKELLVKLGYITVT